MKKRISVILGLCILCLTTGLKVCAAESEGQQLENEVEEEQVSDEVAYYYADLIPKHGKIYTVKQDGTGDFTTIQNGVDRVLDEDVLLIYPGEYEEHVEIIGKTVHLVGVDREKTVIKANSRNYFKVPLYFSAGTVENLTINGYDGGYNEPEYYLIKVAGTDREKRANEFPGYCIHIDSDYSINRNIEILHCNIIGETNNCIGIGTRPGNDILIEDCQIVSKRNAGGFFYHNSRYEGESILTMENIEFILDRPAYAVLMQSISDNNIVKVGFQNVKVYNKKHEEQKNLDVLVCEPSQFDKETDRIKGDFEMDDQEIDESENMKKEETGWNGLSSFQITTSSGNSIQSMNS